ncbi:ribokinase [Ohessyouella blattaphilus]|uniref:Ribokinase n=1 Tax=Ohessyouella blattaphilus TaxID=2949333 RepID=A0ABT1EKC8_9FIRM|nr:ribokinase [Ohessyouella blattaphilus]MCP1111161.1 ribokinase [Ohessyouella blattaphilus]MCR8564555.1 ribokinase [Ohessyouella blattaphilus]
MKVLNFGSLNLDYVYSVEHMVMAGETLDSESLTTFCGGKGLNQSIALAKAGTQVFHAGLVGEEGDILLEACEAAGVNSEYVRKVSGKSGHTIIQVDKKGQNCILLYGGANRGITKEYVDEVLSHFAEGDYIVLQNEINLLDYIIEQAFNRKFKIILNPSPYNANLDSCDFSKISMFLLNEIEGEQITGEKDADKILEVLAEQFPKAQVVLTLGSEGSVYQEAGKKYRQEIYKVQAVDTTAAGDTFTGYFIASRIRGLSIEESLNIAAKAAAIAVSRRGATLSIPLLSEVL